MAAATNYTRSTQFADDERNNAGGRSTVRTAQVDAELDAIGSRLNLTKDNLALIQRDDGEIRDQKVRLHTLSPEVSKLLALTGSTPRGAWVTATAYALRDVVTQSGNTYICAVAHTAGTFSTDLAAGRWILLQLGAATAASGVPFSPTATLVATNVQAAIDEADLDNRALSAAVDARVTTLISDLASTATGKGDALIAVLQTLTGAVGTTQHAYNRRIVSVEDFGARGDGSVTTAQMFTALQAAFASAIGATPHDLYFPPGVYDCGINNFPFRNTSNTPLLDCKNLTLWCSGPGTVLRTTSTDGADVLQLNALQNFHVRGFPTLTGSVSGSVAGTNGVSLTNGFDNITLEVRALNLPCLDKTTFVDGGKALTLQNGATANAIGMLRAVVLADGCAEGFGIEPDLVASMTKNSQIDIHVLARNCYYGVKSVSAGASSALSTSMCSGVRVRGSVVDCQHGVIVQRAHGIDIDVQINSTKTAANKRLKPGGGAWIASDTIVEGAYIAYAKNSRIEVRGNVGACDHKARIGGISAGSSGLNGATEFCDITLDLGGTAAISDLLSLNVGGNSVRKSRLNFTAITAASLPADFTDINNDNRILFGSNYTGSATLTLTGCTTSPTGTVNYSINGDVVTLNFPDILGTSNSTSATLTGLPQEIQPSSPRVAIGRTQNNGADSVSFLDITGSVITLYNGTVFGFTSSGSKGIRLSSVTYKR